VDALSGGRMTLGLAVGARGEDYEVAKVDSRGRGRRFSEQLETIRDIWEEGKIGPTPKGPGPHLLVGGSSGEALARMARYGDGYMHGGGPPRAFAGAAAKALAAWSDLGRPGRPTLWGMGYFALGDGTAESGADYLTYNEIAETFARWNAIDIYYRDTKIRSRGHVFTGISRKVLLNILQRRCQALGVRIDFEREVTDINEFASADLIIGADGI